MRDPGSVAFFLKRGQFFVFAWVLVFSSLFFTTPCRAAEAPILVRNAWIRAAPPNAPVLAAYMTLQNTGSRPQALTGIDSAAFEQVELHRSEIKQGMARMEALKHLELAPGATVVLEPNGMHLMLKGPKNPMREGQRVTLRLNFKDSPAVIVDAEVRKAMPDDQPHHEHSH